MPSSDLLSLRQQVKELQQRNALLESRLANDQAYDQNLYRSLFDTMDEGFCIIEFFDGPHGPHHLLYVNGAAFLPKYRHAGVGDDECLARRGLFLHGCVA